MEDAAGIEARLESLRELAQLVGAMRAVAGARTREAQDALAGTRAYRDIVAQAMIGLAPAPPSGTSEAASGGTAVLLVIASEHGFVAGFNTRVVETALAARSDGERLVVVGRRGATTASERSVEPDARIGMTSRASGVTPLARRIAGEIAESRSVRIVHATPRKGAAYEVETRRILPLEPAGDDPRVAPPLHHLPAAELLAALAVERVFADIAHALMESLAAESAARLMTMDAASHNIEDRLDRLRRDAREVRQERLTAEMLDVVTGAEAVEGD